MNLPRVIPKWLFQLLALLLLLVCVALTIYWTVGEEGLYGLLEQILDARWRGLSGKLMGGFFTFLVLFVGWLVAVLPLRKLSHMPTLEEELGQEVESVSDLVSGLSQLYEREQAKNEELYRAREPLSPRLRRRARRIGVAYVVVGLALLVATGLGLAVSLELGQILWLQVLLALLAPAFILAGLYQIMTGKSVIRR